MKRTLKLFALVGALIGSIATADACTNFIVTRGASTDGSNMVTYAADSHQLYGSLYSYVPGKYTEWMDVTEWDTGRAIGKIRQAQTTYRTLGNSNEHSLFITETTFGGRPELEDPNGGIDYGSLIYITLQRAKTAREAINIIAELANTYGYCSSGESFSLIDTEEAWIMELIGKGPEDKGIVWVARRIPDGYVSAHANQARITTFPWNDPENCLYAKDVADVARKFGWFEGKNEDFSFAEAYAPADFSALRGCEARVWAFFRTVAEGMDKYEDYAMGHNPENRMPLWVKPTEKVSPKLLMDCMRDHYEGTKMDMTQDIGAGGEGCPYRWRPMFFEVDGVEYCNERATATQQTGFWLVGQARPNKVGILWFGTDDAATSPLTPIYVNSTEVPWCLSEENGSMLKYSDTSMFWITNRVAQFAYLRYNTVGKHVRSEVDKWENAMIEYVKDIDMAIANVAYKPKKAAKIATEFSVKSAEILFNYWVELDKYLMVKYIDGNVKGEDANGFIDNGNGKDIPGKIEQPGYSERWKRAVAKDNGEVLKVVKW
ncbi:MAG: C69 family dipeptidase [Alistipes sp.]|nr:C69 family dipeptidase [Alistipes sp.]MBR3892500.1 C69 family dipeptidase [Alistipes sp.]